MDDAQEKIVSELVEVTFPEKDDFLKIRETLSRIGVASRREQELFQSCHILPQAWSLLHHSLQRVIQTRW